MSTTESIPTTAIRITLLPIVIAGPFRLKDGVASARHSRLKDGVASARLCPGIHLFRTIFFSMDTRIRSGPDDCDEVASSPETQSCGYSFPSSRSLGEVSSYFLL
jgi:hypothetical protein